MFSDQPKGKDLNFELNLIPIFDILSVCICFLLMTVAWIQVGSMDVKQAMESEAHDSEESAPAVWATMSKDGKVVLALKNTQALPRKIMDMTIPGSKGGIRWDLVEGRLSVLQKYGPILRTGLIMPDSSVAYEDIVRLMDEMKKYGIRDMGLSPL